MAQLRGGAIAGLRRRGSGGSRLVPGDAGHRGGDEAVDGNGADARGTRHSLAGVASAGVAPVVEAHGDLVQDKINGQS